MPNRTALFVRKQSGGVFTVEDTNRSTGARWYVHSVSGTDAAGGGRNPDAPLATWDYAVGLVTANQGDVIYLMPGHAETITATNTLTLDQAGVETVGLGTGSNRATITVSTDATATVTISAANNTVRNVLFVCATDGINSGLTVSGADATFEDCEFRDATDIEADIWVSVSGNRPTFRNCFFNGYTSGNQQEAQIDLATVDNALVDHCRFIGKVITACVNISAASTSLVVRDSVFYVNSTTDLSLNVVDTATGSTWAVTDCYDLSAGKSFSGGSGGAIAGDDIGAVSTGVSTVNSIVTTVSAGVSTNTSRLTALSTDVSTVRSIAITASTGVSTVNSIVTTASTAATGASTGVSTVNSIVTTVSAGVSSNTSSLTALSTDVSTVRSIAITASTGVSSNASILAALSASISTILSKVNSGW